MKSNPNSGFRPILLGVLLAYVTSLLLSQQLEIQRLKAFVETHSTMEDKSGTPYRLYRQELITDYLTDEARTSKEDIRQLKDTVLRLQMKVNELEWQRMKDSWR